MKTQQVPPHLISNGCQNQKSDGGHLTSLLSKTEVRWATIDQSRGYWLRCNMSQCWLLAQIISNSHYFLENILVQFITVSGGAVSVKK